MQQRDEWSPAVPSPSPPVTGERASLTRRKEVANGAGSDAKARYPQTGDFITNVSARRGEGAVMTGNFPVRGLPYAYDAFPWSMQ